MHELLVTSYWKGIFSSKVFVVRYMGNEMVHVPSPHWLHKLALCADPFLPCIYHVTPTIRKSDDMKSQQE